MARNYDSLYGQESKKVEIRYEIVKLPLQDQVSTVRRFCCKTWQDFKVEKDKLKNSITSSLQGVSNKTRDALNAVGIKNTGVALQAGAVGTAALTGALVARRKSTTARVLYPTLAAGLVWATMYYSTPENRSHLQAQLKSLQNKYLKSK